MKHIFTIDNLLHYLLFMFVLLCTVIYPPCGAIFTLYGREQGQSKSWVLRLSFHKWMEVFVGSFFGILTWELFEKEIRIAIDLLKGLIL